MEERTYNQLKHDLTQAATESLPEGAKASAAEKVAQRLNELVLSNKVMALPEDELHLLLAYRTWKASPKAATGVFHHKVK